MQYLNQSVYLQQSLMYRANVNYADGHKLASFNSQNQWRRYTIVVRTTHPC